MRPNGFMPRLADVRMRLEGAVVRPLPFPTQAAMAG